LRRLADEQASLRRVATLVAGGAQPAEVFTAVADELACLVGAEATFVCRVDLECGEPEGYITVLDSYGRASSEMPVGFRIKLHPGMAPTVALRTGRPARINGERLAIGPLGAVVGRLGLRASVATPIVVGGRNWGVIVASTSREDFPAGTETRMADFMELAATAIANAQSRQELHELAGTQAALRRLAMLVAGDEPPEAVFAAVTKEALRHFGSGTARLIRYELDGTATLLANEGTTGPHVRVRERWEGYPPTGLTATVRHTGRAARVDDYRDIPGGEPYLREGLRSAVALPIYVNGRLWGTIAVGSGQLLPPDTEQRMTEFTDLVATAVANAQNRHSLEASNDELARLLDEQAALRRVATLVARATSPEEVFAAVTAEVGRVLDVDFTVMGRYDGGGVATIVGTWTRAGAPVPLPPDGRVELGGTNVITRVFETGRAGRIDDYADATGATADAIRHWGLRSSAGVPISVDGRLWGVVTVGSTREGPLPEDTEELLAGFTELVATAIANAQARVELRSYAEEQAALRRVATLVARAAPPQEVFAAVTAEVGRVLDVDFTVMGRYDPDGSATILGTWTRAGAPVPLPPDSRVKLGGTNVTTRVFETGRPARLDSYAGASGPAADTGRGWGLRSFVGVPISVDDRIWGVVLVAYTHEQPLPADAEARLAGFTELVATAIANADAQAALAASRARIVAAADATRRRIERDLHDGAQQRLVSLALHLRTTVQAAVPPEAGRLAAALDRVTDELGGVLDDLREIAHGIHPAVLADGGLRPALKTLARRSAVPVSLDVRVDGRLPEQIELAAYYAVAEALTNTAKHARASGVDVDVDAGADMLRIEVRDDGRGGATFASGSGLTGLRDRVEALGGRLTLSSPPGAGTTVAITFPLDDRSTTRAPDADPRRQDHTEQAADPEPSRPPREG
jgi:GAF domain-containing protein